MCQEQQKVPKRKKMKNKATLSTKIKVSEVKYHLNFVNKYVEQSTNKKYLPIVTTFDSSVNYWL